MRLSSSGLFMTRFMSLRSVIVLTLMTALLRADEEQYTEYYALDEQTVALSEQLEEDRTCSGAECR